MYIDMICFLNICQLLQVLPRIRSTIVISNKNQKSRHSNLLHRAPFEILKSIILVLDYNCSLFRRKFVMRRGTFKISEGIRYLLNI